MTGKQGGAKALGGGGLGRGRHQTPMPTTTSTSGAGGQAGASQQLMSVSQVLTQLFISKFNLLARLCTWVDRAEQEAGAGPGSAQLGATVKQLALCFSQQLLAEPLMERRNERPGKLLISPLNSATAAASTMFRLVFPNVGYEGSEYMGLQALVRTSMTLACT